MPSMTDSDKILTIPVAAKILKISRQRLHQLVLDGRIPAEDAGGVWILREQDVREFKKQKRPTGRPPKGDE